MTTRNLDALNRRVEAYYRATYLKEPLEAIAKAVGVRRKQGVRRLLDRAERDERVLRAAAVRCRWAEEQLDKEFEDGRRAATI